MEFWFASAKLKKQLSDQKAMARTFGAQVARRLKSRLAVLSNAQCLADVPRAPPDRCHQLSGDRDEHFAVDVSSNRRLEFEPHHDPIPRHDDGGVDLDRVTEIKLLGVVDYH